MPGPRQPNRPGRAGLILLAVLFCVGGIALIRDTAYNGHDFAVFWRTSKYVLEGQPAYSVARDGAMVFKYPPWIVPAFFPFAAFSLDQALWLWGVIEVLSLALILVWLARLGLRKSVLAAVTAGFWGIWAVHALDGQVVLPVLCAALWLWSPTGGPRGSKAVTRTMFLVYSLSTKIFTVFPLLEKWRELKKAKQLLSVAAIFGILSLPAIWTTPSHDPARLFADWAEAARSGELQFGTAKVRGPENQSLVALILRHFQAPPQAGWADLSAFAFCATLLGLLWHRFSRKTPPLTRYLGWLALTPAVHPLPWFHLFAFTFPLAAFSIDLSLQARKPGVFAIALLGTLLVTLVTEKTLGGLGLSLEQASIKSWGALLIAGAAVRAQTLRRQGHDERLAFSDDKRMLVLRREDS